MPGARALPVAHPPPLSGGRLDRFRPGRSWQSQPPQLAGQRSARVTGGVGGTGSDCRQREPGRPYRGVAGGCALPVSEGWSLALLAARARWFGRGVLLGCDLDPSRQRSPPGPRCRGAAGLGWIGAVSASCWQAAPAAGEAWAKKPPRIGWRVIQRTDRNQRRQSQQECHD